jgi:hypothetical protein
MNDTCMADSRLAQIAIGQIVFGVDRNDNATGIALSTFYQLLIVLVFAVFVIPSP